MMINTISNYWNETRLDRQLAWDDFKHSFNGLISFFKVSFWDGHLIISDTGEINETGTFLNKVFNTLIILFALSIVISILVNPYISGVLSIVLASYVALVILRQISCAYSRYNENRDIKRGMRRPFQSAPKAFYQKQMRDFIKRTLVFSAIMLALLLFTSVFTMPIFTSSITLLVLAAIVSVMAIRAIYGENIFIKYWQIFLYEYNHNHLGQNRNEQNSLKPSTTYFNSANIYRIVLILTVAAIISAILISNPITIGILASMIISFTLIMAMKSFLKTYDKKNNILIGNLSMLPTLFWINQSSKADSENTEELYTEINQQEEELTVEDHVGESHVEEYSEEDQKSISSVNSIFSLDNLDYNDDCYFDILSECDSVESEEKTLTNKSSSFDGETTGEESSSDELEIRPSSYR